MSLKFGRSERTVELRSTATIGENNVAELMITVPAHPGKQGVAPLADTDPPTNEPSEH